MSGLFWIMFAAACLGGIASKVVSLLIDALVWLRSIVADIAAEVACRRKAKRGKAS